ncbi:unnamed protein product [Cylicostephanus goldi]|uniref:Uncharacterized protein n=1 Tax=Cylicostephanus goldi TaxID=71465 RepID=A0A3P6T4F1_CYLGO|nr:unnamed protein product [Cylicostephanus goldi]
MISVEVSAAGEAFVNLTDSNGKATSNPNSTYGPMFKGRSGQVRAL